MALAGAVGIFCHITHITSQSGVQNQDVLVMSLWGVVWARLVFFIIL